MQGRHVAEKLARAGVRWVRNEHRCSSRHSRNSTRSLALGSVSAFPARPLEFALVSPDDLLPGLMDIPLFATSTSQRVRWLAEGRPV